MRPGSYDFGRDMYFQGIGASGFAMGAIKTVEAPGSGGLSLRYAAFMQGLRDAIDAQRAYNFWSTKEAETISLAPSAAYIGTSRQFEGFCGRGARKRNPRESIDQEIYR